MIADQPPDDHPPYARRFKRKIVCLCSLTALATVLFYSMTASNAGGWRFAAQSSTPSWDVSSYLHTAFRQLQTAIVLPRPRKLVLLWTPYFSQGRVWLPSTRDLECPVYDCDVTDNHSLLARSDAVVMHWRDVDLNDLPRCERPARCPRWVLFNKEAPPHTSRDLLAKIQDRVNWTVTYRKDSDIFAPYGKLVPVGKTVPVIPNENGDRTRICWLVSNCDTPSKRELFVQELQKSIEVDIYGRCGPNKCAQPDRMACYNWLAKTCRLYLSFENSNCKDYITEKLFNALQAGMIPVVRGRNIDYSAHLPPRSYIDADDFSGPKELAEYLKSVIENRAKYLSYHWWRKNYRAVDFSYRWFCDLCRKLHNETEVTRVEPRNLVSWWYEESGCSS